MREMEESDLKRSKARQRSPRPSKPPADDRIQVETSTAQPRETFIEIADQIVSMLKTN